MTAMAPYLALIIAAVIGVITIISKTDTEPEKGKAEKKMSLLKRPTFWGYMVILLTVAGCIFGWVMENDKAKKEEIAKLTRFKDSTDQSNSFKNIDHKQVLALNKQGKQILADSIQRVLDSLNRIAEQNRYDTTLNRFRTGFANEQQSLENEKAALGNQIVTLNHIEESQHPLRPLIASFRYLIHVPAIFFDTCKVFQKKLAPLKGHRYQ